LFHFDGGLKLTAADLAVDFRRTQPRGFISHAHTDHMARHALALCTPATAALYHLRCGVRPVMEMPYRQSVEWGGLRLTTYPAGHCLGSAMLLADDGERTLLYTGDFKLGPSATSEAAELPRADVLVMESTFGDPKYRLPPREEVIGELVALVRRILDGGRTPVIEAYALGKAQEVTRILTDAGISVLQHHEVHRVSQVYEQLGVPMGGAMRHAANLVQGKAVVVPPGRRGQALSGVKKPVRIAVTGWAGDPSAKYRLGVDHAVPLSDHADYDDLLATVERVNPREVYCTHGPASFVDRLLDAGWNAFVLGLPARQGRLF
jgi:Cft2 family RNA processing exonuclease